MTPPADAEATPPGPASESVGGSGLRDARRGTAESWRPTVAHVRATLVGVTSIALAVTAGRPDLLVIGAPFALIAVWGTLTRPSSTPTPFDRIGNTTVREGDATVWRAAVVDLEGADLVRVDVPPTPWIETDPEHGSIAVPVVDDRATVAMSVRATRWAGG